MGLKFVMRQWIKMAVQRFFLPLVYRVYKHGKIDEKLIVFADAHHSGLPYSMETIRGEIGKLDYKIVDLYVDYQKESYLKTIKAMILFMKYYAKARYVFICDNFLPVASCKKRKETTVIQLWHAGGILKKYAYDTEDDIPPFYKGNVFKNYDFLTVSAKCCIPVYNRAMRQPEGVVHATGLSKTDRFFDAAYIDKCKMQFLEMHPEHKEKKLILWAPTFRGKASDPYVIGLEEIRTLQQQLGDKWHIIIKAHPHVDSKGKVSNCDIPTEQLLPVADLLIVDYSSVLFDYVLLNKPMVLFAPDLEHYERERGFYIDYRSIPGTLALDGSKLKESVIKELEEFDVEKIKIFKNKYMGACDGKATNRILKELNIK